MVLTMTEDEQSVSKDTSPGQRCDVMGYRKCSPDIDTDQIGEDKQINADKSNGAFFA